MFYRKPTNLFLKSLKTIKTPAIVFNIDDLTFTINKIKNIVSKIPRSKLHLALKSCHNIEVLKSVSSLINGCDVASIQELEIAKKSGFTKITSTGPAFSTSDFKVFNDNNIIVDISSLDQLIEYGINFQNTEIGLRLRFNFPEEYMTSSTFYSDSRFGIDVSKDDVLNVCKKYNLKIVSLHVHTGQFTAETLIYKLKYFLNILEVFKDVKIINFGGGFFHFLSEIDKIDLCIEEFNTIRQNWEKLNSREIEIFFEPGGAMLTMAGYLVTSIKSIEYHPYFNKRLITVDSSAWNLAPWLLPRIKALDNLEEQKTTEVLIGGNTLYENDFFGKTIIGDQFKLFLPTVKVNDRIMMDAFGGYTLTNSRNFNAIPNPKIYLYKKNELT